MFNVGLVKSRLAHGITFLRQPRYGISISGTLPVRSLLGCSYITDVFGSVSYITDVLRLSKVPKAPEMWGLGGVLWVLGGGRWFLGMIASLNCSRGEVLERNRISPTTFFCLWIASYIADTSDRISPTLLSYIADTCFVYRRHTVILRRKTHVACSDHELRITRARCFTDLTKKRFYN